MKVLWVSNVSPCAFSGVDAHNIGGWLRGQYDFLMSKNLEIFAIFPGSKCISGDGFLQFKIKRFFYNKSKVESVFSDVIESFKPDLVHIHGTEMWHSSICAAICLKQNIPYLVSLQGIVSEISKHVLTGLNYKEIVGKSLRDMILGSSVIDQCKNFENLGEAEIYTVAHANAVLGRTGWDQAWTKYIACNPHYVYSAEPLRNSFYDSKKWSYGNCIKYQIFMSQAAVSIKGAHIALDAINMLKSKYPDIRLKIAGANYYEPSIRNLLFPTNYQMKIVSKIKKYHLQDSVSFLGGLTDCEMIIEYLQANIFILPSMIENSPNSLMEAVYLGVPSAASYVGGVPSLFSAGNNVILYQSDSALMLAAAIDSTFEATSSRTTNCHYFNAVPVDVIGDNIYSIYTKLASEGLELKI